METIARQLVDRWHDDQGEYLGLIVGMLCAKGVPVGQHQLALDELLLVCRVSLELEVLPGSGLPDFYEDDDPVRAASYNWILLLVDAWVAAHRGRLNPSPDSAAMIATTLVSFVRGLPQEARATIRRRARLEDVN